jgi:hypothetical protein
MKKPQARQKQLAIISAPFRPAVFGAIGQYVEVRPGTLHGKQPTLLMRLDVSQQAAIGAPVTGPGYALSGVQTGRPVALVAVCLGKIFAVAAFNPLDPETRKKMQDVTKSDRFTCAFLFDLPVGKEPPPRIDHALVSVPLDVFSKTLSSTEGMASVGTNDWLETAPGLIASGMSSMGASPDLFKKSHFRPFLVFPESVVRDSTQHH